MKSSAWYNRLWRKKLNELPVKEDAEPAWAEMNKLLDKHMPAPHSSNGTLKFGAAKLISLLGYILPAAAMIGGVTYVSVHVSKLAKAKAKKENITHQRFRDHLKKGATLPADSLLLKDSSSLLPGDLTGVDSIMEQVALPGKGRPLVQVGGKESNFADLKKAGGLPLRRGEIKVNQQKPDLEKSNRKLLVYHTTKSLAEQKKIALHSPVELKIADGINPVSPLEQVAIPSGHAGNNDTVKDGRLATAIIRDKRETLQSSNYPVIKNPKLKQGKAKVKNNDPGLQTDLPATNYGIEAGLSLTGGKNLYFGITGSYSIDKKWLINGGLRLDMSRHLSGVHTHRSFNPVDSSAFKVYDSRKVRALSIPIQVGYRLFNNVSIHAGPQFSYALKQTDRVSKLGPIASYRDTLSKSSSIDSAFNRSSVNKLTIGASAGLSLRLGSFYVDGRYLQNITPYKVNTGLGSYKQYYRSLQLGLRYQFKK